MEIDGKHMGTSSVTRGLARHKLQKSQGEEPPNEGGEAGGDMAKQHLAKAHPEAANAEKSFHHYMADGKHHTHAHDHQAGTHEHREHADHAGAMAHHEEHMGGGGYAGPETGDETTSEMPGGMGGMEQMGMQ